MRQRLAILIGAAMLAGCGYSSPVTPGGSAETPPPPLSPTVAATSTKMLAQFDPSFIGTIEFNIAWTDPAQNLDLYATDAGCVTLPANPLAGGCNVLGYSTTIGTTSERVTVSTRPSTLVRFWVVNLGTSAQAVTFSHIDRF